MTIKKSVADALNQLQLLRWRASEINDMDEYNYPVVFPIDIILGDKEYTPAQKKLHEELDINHEQQKELVRWLREHGGKEISDLVSFGESAEIDYWSIPIYFKNEELVIIDD